MRDRSKMRLSIASCRRMLRRHRGVLFALLAVELFTFVDGYRLVEAREAHLQAEEQYRIGLAAYFDVELPEPEPVERLWKRLQKGVAGSLERLEDEHLPALGARVEHFRRRLVEALPEPP